MGCLDMCGPNRAMDPAPRRRRGSSPRRWAMRSIATTSIRAAYLLAAFQLVSIVGSVPASANNWFSPDDSKSLAELQLMNDAELAEEANGACEFLTVAEFRLLGDFRADARRYLDTIARVARNKHRGTVPKWMEDYLVASRKKKTNKDDFPCIAPWSDPSNHRKNAQGTGAALRDPHPREDANGDEGAKDGNRAPSGDRDLTKLKVGNHGDIQSPSWRPPVPPSEPGASCCCEVRSF
jgi:hypothetical protein